MSQEMVTQCTIEKKTEQGVLKRVMWGDSIAAVKGREVKVQEDNGTWSTGWTVTEVYGEPMPRSLIQHRSHDHTRQRKASDI